ncbi:hypothetical protein HW130_25320 [Streptomyces sp. PKU-EA00015]|uniref:hypothetical protein n=1 Tax=Streptomyces sp. PKU-EA00015 TaxID=2748326 RepID=UPI0015A2A5E3|nr:hypothetical protein [Streptomyces sp. PKU-EA00015]NWF29533.1 hypothetical protein [Streptomyces sp. PKU-EA00015]
MRNSGVLVRRNAGYNRFGLVIARTLIELGWEATTAIEAVQAGTIPLGLNNSLT